MFTLLLQSLASVTVPVVDFEFSAIANGFCSPRGLTVREGWVWIAEAGYVDRESGICTFDDKCASPTGRVQRIDLDDNSVEAIHSGLFSFGGEGTGPVKVEFAPNGDRLIAVGFGSHLSHDTLLAAGVTNGDQASSVLRYQCTTAGMGMGMGNAVPQCSLQRVANVLSDELENDWDGAGPDSNVFSIVLNPADGRQVLVADAGANTVSSYDINTRRRVATVTLPVVQRPCVPRGAVGPCQLSGGGPFFCCPLEQSGDVKQSATYPSQAVPTAVIARPGFANEVYVTELTGAIWNSDQASVWRFSTRPLALGEKFVTGFNAIISATFDGPRRLYVLEQNFFGLGSFEGSNRLTLVNMDTRAKTVISTNLQRATHITVANGVMFASDENDHVVCNGSVVRLDIHKTAAGCPCSQDSPCYNPRTGLCSEARRGKCRGTTVDTCGLLED